jgi:hypothetical protein
MCSFKSMEKFITMESHVHDDNLIADAVTTDT